MIAATKTISTIITAGVSQAIARGPHRKYRPGSVPYGISGGTDGHRRTMCPTNSSCVKSARATASHTIKGAAIRARYPSGACLFPPRPVSCGARAKLAAMRNDAPRAAIVVCTAAAALAAFARLGGAQETTPRPTPTAPACARPNVAASVIRAETPMTPPIAAQQGILGTVHVVVSLDADSRVVGTRIQSSPSAVLNAAALAAARQ